MGRSDTVQHGSISMYRTYGCRCLPCSVAESEYQRQWRKGNLRRVPVDEVLKDIRRLKRAGWTYDQIRKDCELSTSSLWSIRNKQTHVNSRTAAKIAELASVLDETECRLPVGPLVDLVEGRDLAVLSTFEEADRRAYYRAKKQGWVSERIADRIVTGVLGKPMMLVWPELLGDVA